MSILTPHRKIQEVLGSLLPKGEREKPFKKIGRIGDLVWEEKKIVFEVQFSPMHPIEARERMGDYASIGYRVIWILHENMFNPLRLTPFQELIQPFPHFYTNIDPLLGGEIYSIKIQGGKIERIPIQLHQLAISGTFFRKIHLRCYFLIRSKF